MFTNPLEASSSDGAFELYDSRLGMSFKTWLTDAGIASFDFVLIDTPPLLAVTDPSIVCSHVDLVYMVMRIRNGVRTNSTRAKEIIDSMGIELGGVVINGIRRRDHKTYEYSGQYGYSGYGGNAAQRNGNGAPPRQIACPNACLAV